MIRTIAVIAALLFHLPAAAELRGHGGPVRAVAVSPDGRLALSGSFDQSAILWAIDGGAALAVLRFHAGAVNAVAALPDGRFATGGEDATLRVWPAEGAPGVRQTATPLNALAAAPDGTLAAGGADGGVMLFAADGAALGSVQAGSTPVIALGFSPDGARLAAASIGGAVAVVERASLKPAFTLVGPGLPVWSLAFRPDGAELLTGGADRLVRRWDMRTGEHIGAVVIARPEDVL